MCCARTSAIRVDIAVVMLWPLQPTRCDAMRSSPISVVRGGHEEYCPPRVTVALPKLEDFINVNVQHGYLNEVTDETFPSLTNAGSNGSNRVSWNAPAPDA